MWANMVQRFVLAVYVDRTKEMGLFSAPLLTAVKHNS
jgi:hypothetical protein